MKQNTIRTSPGLLGRTFPGGVYKAQATDHKVGTSQAGNPKMSIGFTLTSEGPDPAIKTIGRKIFANVTFTEESIWFGNQIHVAATGKDLPDKDFTPDEFFTYLWSKVDKKNFILTISEGKGLDGTTRMNIDSIAGQPK